MPPGFAAVERQGVRLIAEEASLDALLAAGLDRPERWSALLAGAAEGAGRGGTAVLRLEERRPVRIKRLLRGGWTRSLRRDRFPRGRLDDNLAIPLEARRRGVPTPAPVALLARPAGGGWEGWMAVEEIEGGVDLSRLCSADPVPGREPLRVCLQAVRQMHDAGVEHRDLNLGNLLWRDAPSGAEAWVLDLDRARLHPGGLSVTLRARGLRRLERSHAKLCHTLERDGAGDRRDWPALYAGDDAALAHRLAAGAWSRAALRLHRLGWRR